MTPILYHRSEEDILWMPRYSAKWPSIYINEYTNICEPFCVMTSPTVSLGNVMDAAVQRKVAFRKGYIYI